MVFLVRCDKCNKIQEVEIDNSSWPSNPINPETGEKWYSRYEQSTKKTEHACRLEHCNTEKHMVWPKWAEP